MPSLFWLDVVALSASLVMAAALTLMVAGFGLGLALNRSFVALALTHVAWAVFSLLMRLTLWLEKGNPLFMSELISLSLALTGICLLIFTVRYLGRPTHWTDLAVVVGLAMVALLCVPLFRHQLVSSPRLDANGTTLADVSTWGLAAAVLPLVYMAWSLVLFWQERRHTEEPYLALSVTILLAGYIAGGVLEIRVPITSVTHILSLAFLGYGVVSRQLFNPLQERTVELQREIMERKRAEEARQKSELLYHDLVETAQDLIWQCDAQGRYIYLNPAWEAVFGYPVVEMLGKTFSDFQTPEYAQRDMLEFSRLMHGNSVVGYETAHLGRDGREIQLVFNAKFIRDAQGNITGTRGTAYDVTARKQAETALRESERRMREIVDHAPFGAHLYELEAGQRLVFIGANRAADQILGVDNQRFIGKTIEEAFPPLIQTDVPDAYRSVAATGERYDVDQVDYDEGGIRGAFEVHAFQTGPNRMAAFFRDITERKRAEKQVQQRLNELATVNAISQASASQLELNTLLKLVAERLLQTFDIQGVYISLYDRKTNLLDFPYWWCLGRKLQVRSQPLVKGLAAAIFQSGQPLLINENYDQRFAELGGVRVAIPENKYPQAWLGVPMLAGNEIIGVISVQNFEHENAFTEADVRLLTTIAANVGIAIQNAQLYTTAQQELAERKRSEEALRESEEKYRQLFELESDAVVLIDNETGRILEANTAASALYGYTREELLCKKNSDLSAEPEETRRVTRTTPVIADQVVFIPLRFHRKSDGAVFPIEITGRFFHWRGRPVHIAAIRDITERKRAEQVQVAIHRISEAAQTTQDLSELYASIHAIVGELMPAKNFYIALYDASDDLFVVPYIVDEFEVLPPPYKPGKGLNAYVMRTKEPLLATPEVFEQLVQSGQVELIGRPIVDWLGVPLKTQRGTIGVMAVYTYTEAIRLREVDKDILVFVSTQMAMAIERKRAEEALRESEARYRAVIESQVDLISRYLPDTTLTFVNDAYCQFFGKTREELIGHSYLFMIAPEFRELVRKETEDLAKNPRPLAGEYVNYRHDGKECWIQWVVQCISDETGRVVELQAVGRDITERKQAEAQLERALRETRVRYEVSRALASAQTEEQVLDVLAEQSGLYPQAGVDIMTLKRGEDGDRTLVSRRSSPFDSGFPPTPQGTRFPASQFPLVNLITPDTPLVSSDVLRDERVDENTRALASQEGWGSMVLVPITAGDDWLGVVVAISKQEGYFDEEKQHLYQTLAEQGAVALHAARLRETIRESQQRFQGLVETLSDWIWEIDQNGVYTYVSPKVQDLLGYEPKEVLGKTPFDFMPPEEAQRVAGVFGPLLAAHQLLVALENTNRHKDGHLVVFETNGAPFFDAEGRFKGYRGIDRDITERKQAEEEIRKLNEELEQRVVERTAQLEAANKELEAFSYSVSHDLRTPLRALDGFSRILLEDYAPQLSSEVARYLRIIRESSQQMGHLIEDLLAFSRLSRQPLNKQPVATADLVRQVIESLRGEQEGRHVEIAVGELPACQGDPALLRQVWVNLLSNALKFTRGREVARIEVGCMDQEGESVYFVRDNGVGFDMQYASKLFGVFQRLHRDDEFEGTGIGLATVQRIIHRHGGRVWAESDGPGTGATFYFVLPTTP